MAWATCVETYSSILAPTAFESYLYKQDLAFLDTH